MKNLFSLVVLISFFTFTYAQQWVQKASMPNGSNRHHPVTWAFGDTAYVLTGTVSNTVQGFQTDDFYMYIGSSDSWSTLPDFPGPDRSFAYGQTYNGKGYIGFGASQFAGYINDLWEYDPSTQTWTELATCPCSGRRHPAFVINDGKVFVGLGDDANGNLNDWWAYDIATDKWGQMPNLPGPQRHHPFHFTSGEYVYAGMGHGTPFIYDDWYRFDPADSSWTPMATFPGEARVAGTEFSHLDKGYVLSGQGSDHDYLDTGEFWEYSPDTDNWTQLTAHPGAGRWAPGSFVLNNMAFLVAGENSQGALLNDMWAYQLPEPEEPVDSNVNTAISSISKNNLVVYPNPAQNTLYFKSQTQEEQFEIVSIFNTYGQEFPVQKQNNTIDISELSSGVYFLYTLSNSGEKSQTRFIKQ